MDEQKKCPKCCGTGEVEVMEEWPLQDCFKCRGTGKVRETATLAEVMLQKNGYEKLS